MKRTALSLAALLALGSIAVSPVAAQVSAVPQLMNFQGRLATPSGTPVADGTYSVRFSLWNAVSAGTENWNQTVASVIVKNGTFAVQLSNFPIGTFNSNQWLEIKIGNDAALTPRQQLITTPYAFKADMALTVPDGSITNAKIAAGTITADRFAANIFNPLAWLLGGNSATNPVTNFLGTTENQPLVFKVNNRRAMQYQYADNGTYRSMNLLGGSEINTIAAGVIGATIAGGGYDSLTGTDDPNRVLADFGTVGGGTGNTAIGYYSFVGGGSSNTAGANYATAAGGVFNTASGYAATVGGGLSNISSASSSTVAGGETNIASGNRSTVGGGIQNSVSGDYATIAGGDGNTANAPLAAIGGGIANSVSGYAATIAGGDSNSASGLRPTVGGGIHNSSIGDYATVGGGNGNTASNQYATVAGGYANTAAGLYSFAAGQQAQANHDGSFVWNDSINSNFASTAVNQFLIRAAGGVGINTNTPAGNALNVAGTAQMTGFKLPTGAAANKVLTSDATGVGTWGLLTAASIADGTLTADKFVGGVFTPGGTAGGDLSGTYPNPTLAIKTSSLAKVSGGYLSMGQTIGLLDQVQTSVPRIGSGGPYTQTFTPAVSGNLTQIDVFGGSSDPVNHPTVNATLYLHRFSTGGPIIYSQSITLFPFGGFSPLVLSSQVAVTAGVVYAWEITAANGPLQFGYSDANPYAGGQAGTGTANDFAFLTYVTHQGLIASTYLGINTNAPAYPLDVNGTSRFQASGTRAVIGTSNTNSGLFGSSTSGSGVEGSSTSNSGVYGSSNTSNGVRGSGNTSTGNGVYGDHISTGNYGSLGSIFTGVTGYANSGGIGVFGSAAKRSDAPEGGAGVAGEARNVDAIGVKGYNNYGGIGVWGKGGTGVYAESTSGGNGVFGYNDNAGNGVSGYNNQNGTGVYGRGGQYGVYAVGTGWALYANGLAGGTQAWLNISDARYKQHITTFPDALNTILNLRGVTFDWRNDEFKNMNFSHGKQIGFIAQEVEKILPQLVSTDSNGYKSVAYANLVPVLVEAVKTLKKDNDATKRENAELKVKNEALEARLERIEDALKANK